MGSQEYFFIKTIKITKRADLKNHLLFDNIDLTIYSKIEEMGSALFKGCTIMGLLEHHW